MANGKAKAKACKKQVARALANIQSACASHHACAYPPKFQQEIQARLSELQEIRAKLSDDIAAGAMPDAQRAKQACSESRKTEKSIWAMRCVMDKHC